MAVCWKRTLALGGLYFLSVSIPVNIGLGGSEGVFICNLMSIGRWSELSIDSVCHEHEVMRDAYANETSGELGSEFGGTLVGLSQLRIPSVLHLMVYNHNCDGV